MHIQGNGAIGLIVVILILITIAALLVKPKLLSAEADRRVRLSNRVHAAADLLIFAALTDAPSAAHELERDCAGVLRAVIAEINHAHFLEAVEKKSTCKHGIARECERCTTEAMACLARQRLGGVL